MGLCSHIDRAGCDYCDPHAARGRGLKVAAPSFFPDFEVTEQRTTQLSRKVPQERIASALERIATALERGAK